MSQRTALLQIARENLSREAYRVLMVILASLDDDYQTRLSQREIAELLDMNKQAISRAFQLLIQRNILIPQSANCRPRLYALNRNLGAN